MPCSFAALLSPRSARLGLLPASLPAALALWLCVASPLRAITIELDYTYDASGLFGTAQSPTPARAALEFAVRAFEPFTDVLTAIQPGGGNTWTARTINPGAGSNLDLDLADLAVPADTLRVFAGFNNLPGSQLGVAGPGTYAVAPTGSTAFVNAVLNRGQGSSQTDFAPWGGFISFDTTTNDGAPRQWHFDVNTSPPAGVYDLYTVAVHELAHMMGFGLAEAFLNQVDSETNRFTGPTATALYGDGVPVTAEHQHWAAVVTSPPYVGVQPKPSMGPTLASGQRKTLTPLDYAALADTGWSITPELLTLPGDVDQDADVDGEDFLVWQRVLGSVGAVPGDANGDQVVDDFDGWIIRRNIGALGSGPGQSIVAASVPEPTGPAATALLAAVARRRRRR
jgi:hypothetical protein